MSSQDPGNFITKNNVAPTSSFSTTPAPGIWSLDEQLQYKQAGVWPTAIANAVEDVFSTWLYSGNSSTNPIPNGINLSTFGGLVWMKGRTNAGYSNVLSDTTRGISNALISDTTGAQYSNPTGITSVSTNGFTLGSASGTNGTIGGNYVSWTFRKQAKFFDVVTYTGNNASNRAISHNLGSTPGFILVKATSTTGDWYALHRVGNAGSWGVGTLNSTGTFTAPSPLFWGNGTTFTAPTSTTFTVSADGGNLTNGSGVTFVAYLFAHDAGGFGASGNDNVISCGSYTGNGGSQNITLGYEPQWLLIKKVSTTDINSYWAINDNMRSALTSNGNVFQLQPNTAAAEDALGTITAGPRATPTGFSYVSSTYGAYNASGETYIYIAIRRGPMRPPTSGTSVFSPATSSAAAGTVVTTSFPIDLQINSLRGGAVTGSTVDRLRGVSSAAATSLPRLFTYDTAAEANAATTENFNNTGFTIPTAWAGTSTAYWNFRRAPGFMDVVCYTGTGVTNRTVTHNLTVAPELLFVKARNNIQNWSVLCTLSGGLQGRLNTTAALSAPSAAVWGNGTSYVAPTSTVFTVGTDNETNANTWTYVAYLFATAPGVSKVGSYTGTGATQTINCGFTTGARWVLIKRVDTTGDWYAWDTARGMVAGTDPYILLNSTAAEVNTNSVYTTSVGFQIVSTAAGINASGGTYIFLAIA